MIAVLINGLYYNNETNTGISVNLFYNSLNSSDLGKLILNMTSDKFGRAYGEIDVPLIENNITLSIIAPGFVPLQVKLTVTQLGIFYTPKLEFDSAYIGSAGLIKNGSEWESQSEFTKAQSELQSDIRNYRFQNYGIKYAHYFIILISIIVGLFAISPYNLIFSILFFLIGEILGPYAIGLKPFWKRK